MECEPSPSAVDLAPAPAASVYRFLARSIKYPDPTWLDEAYWHAFTALAATAGLADSREILSRSGGDPTTLESLQVEYTRLFINAAPHVIAPPYGSVYLSDDGMLYGNSAVLTKNFYRKCGFDLPGEADIPDHLGLELEFLALLAEEGREEEEALFLRDHFRPWYPEFQARVLADARHPFYRVLVQLIDFFTREEWDNGIESDET